MAEPDRSSATSRSARTSATSANLAATRLPTALCDRAARVIVMTDTARRLVVEAGASAADKIRVVPHGAPVVLGRRRNEDAADRHPLHVAPASAGSEQTKSRFVLSTLGLLSAGKGLETAIEALALASGAGQIVPFDDSRALAEAVCDLVEQPDLLATARAEARRIGSTLTWLSVASATARVLREAVTQVPPRAPLLPVLLPRPRGEITSSRFEGSPEVGRVAQ